MLVLNRLTHNLFGVFGVFIYEKKVLCNTLELPWNGNIQGVSSIPLGEYSVIKAVSPRHGKVFYVKDVPFRDGILIHPGNTTKDSRGCILPGLVVEENGVSYSRQAMERLYVSLPSNFQMIVRES